jgi:cobalt/nickel transport system permease protein
VHIPDGYLSPQTCVVGYAVAVPTWTVACRRVTAVVKNRDVPLLAVLAALCFLVMMFNVPVPDGTTAHAVGGSIVAIVVGPWAAVIAVSVALGFQALLFGDGGILTYGVNVVNMALILPFVGYGVYRLLAGTASLDARRRVLAAAAGGYVGINAAALAAAIEFGIQPDWFHRDDGTPLYAPFHLSQTIPAMALAHLTVAGAAEAILSAAVLAYLQRADITRLRASHPGIPSTAAVAGRPAAASRNRFLSPVRVAGVFILLMIVLSPIGLLAPGGAFGEDSPQDLDLGAYGLHVVPSGLNTYAGYWSHTLLDGYGFASGDHPNIGYIASALLGTLVVGTGIFLIGTLVRVVLRTRRAAPVDTGHRGERAEAS